MKTDHHQVVVYGEFGQIRFATRNPWLEAGAKGSPKLDLLLNAMPEMKSVDS
jgi:hypothetical protein